MLRVKLYTRAVLFYFTVYERISLLSFSRTNFFKRENVCWGEADGRINKQISWPTVGRGRERGKVMSSSGITNTLKGHQQSSPTLKVLRGKKRKQKKTTQRIQRFKSVQLTLHRHSALQTAHLTIAPQQWSQKCRNIFTHQTSIHQSACPDLGFWGAAQTAGPKHTCTWTKWPVTSGQIHCTTEALPYRLNQRMQVNEVHETHVDWLDKLLSSLILKYHSRSSVPQPG